MNAMLARLLGQAETSLADAARRTVDSVTGPIVLKTQTLAAETIGAATRTIKVVVIQAVLGLVAAAMAVVAIVYAVAALYDALLPMLGPVEAKLAMAGVFALIAVVAILAMVFWPKGGSSDRTRATPAPVADARRVVEKAQSASAEARTAAKQAARAEPLADAAAAAGAAPVSGLSSHVDTIVDVLGQAGFHREKAGLRAGLALASQLKPMQIVALALIGGFIAGVRTPTRR